MKSLSKEVHTAKDIWIGEKLTKGLWLNVLKTTAFILVMLLSSNFVNAQNGGPKNVNNKMQVMSFNKYLPNAIVDSGYFSMEKEDGSVWIQMSDETSRNKQHYMIESSFELAEFITEEGKGSTVSRKSGVLKFSESVNDKGIFTFEKNVEFVDFLKDAGVALDNDLYYFKLFLGDIDKYYVLDIKNLGFEPTITELGRLVWHDTSIKYIEEMKTMFPSFDLSDISQLSANGVTIEYLKELKEMGIAEMDVQSIKKAKSMKITTKQIKHQKRKGNVFTDLASYIRLFKGK